MAWNVSVSVLFVIIECLCTGFVYLRAKNDSENPYIRAQLYLMPFMCTTIALELCELLLWLDPTAPLLSITDTQQKEPCSWYNFVLTNIAYVGLVPQMSFWMVFPCRRVGPFENRDLMKVIEGMAFFHAMIVWYCFYLKWMSDHNEKGTHPFRGTKYNNPLLELWYYSYSWLHNYGIEPLASRQAIQEHNYQSFHNEETCTFLGRHIGLFMTLNTSDSWITPNAASYFLATLGVIFCRPYRFASGFFVGLGVLIFLQVNYYRSSEMTYLIACSGLLCQFYFVLQPYVFPIYPKEYEYDQSRDNMLKTNEGIMHDMPYKRGPLPPQDDWWNMATTDNNNKKAL